MKKHLLRLMSFWPPYLGAGISIDYMAPDFSVIDVSMKLKFWNKNYLNTQFGGSLYSMTDPFFVLMLIQKLGPEFIVWDKKASIEFLKPGKGKVFAHFELKNEKIEEIKNKLIDQRKIYPEFTVEIKDKDDQIIARVVKTLYISKKL